MADYTSRRGRCACGAVTFEGKMPREYHACHCETCRRWAGGVFMAIEAREVRFVQPENLNRWRSSEWAERASCRYCGSALFWRALGNEIYMLNVGALGDQSGLQFAGEVYVDEQPDHYRFEGARDRLTGEECRALHRAEAKEGSKP